MIVTDMRNISVILTYQDIPSGFVPFPLPSQPKIFLCCGSLLGLSWLESNAWIQTTKIYGHAALLPQNTMRIVTTAVAHAHILS